MVEEKLQYEKIIFGITGLTLGGAERVLVDVANKLIAKYMMLQFYNLCWRRARKRA